MPIGRLLILVRHVQHLRFGEIVADNLQPHRAAIAAEWDLKKQLATEITEHTEETLCYLCVL